MSDCFPMRMSPNATIADAFQSCGDRAERLRPAEFRSHAEQRCRQHKDPARNFAHYRVGRESCFRRLLPRFYNSEFNEDSAAPRGAQSTPRTVPGEIRPPGIGG